MGVLGAVRRPARRWERLVRGVATESSAMVPTLGGEATLRRFNEAPLPREPKLEVGPPNPPWDWKLL